MLGIKSLWVSCYCPRGHKTLQSQPLCLHPDKPKVREGGGWGGKTLDNQVHFIRITHESSPSDFCLHELVCHVVNPSHSGKWEMQFLAGNIATEQKPKVPLTRKKGKMDFGGSN